MSKRLQDDDGGRPSKSVKLDAETVARIGALEADNARLVAENDALRKKNFSMATKCGLFVHYRDFVITTRNDNNGAINRIRKMQKRDGAPMTVDELREEFNLSIELFTTQLKSLNRWFALYGTQKIPLPGNTTDVTRSSLDIAPDVQ
jgi:hypothetical protein